MDTETPTPPPDSPFTEERAEAGVSLGDGIQTEVIANGLHPATSCVAGLRLVQHALTEMGVDVMSSAPMLAQMLVRVASMPVVPLDEEDGDEG